MVYLRYLIKDNQGNIIYRLLDSKTGYMADVSKSFIDSNKSNIDISLCTEIHVSSISHSRTLNTGFNDFETWCRLNKRLDLLSEYSKDNEYKSNSISKGSGKIVYWECSKCGNVWQSSVVQRTKSGGKCPACPRSRHSKYGEDLYTWASKNNPRLIEEYSPKNKASMSEISKASHTVVKWVCSECGYEWESPVCTRSSMKAGCRACSAMAGKGQFVVGVNDLFTWASENNPKLIKEYSKNNEVDIHRISRASNNKVEWVCSLCGHKWFERVRIRTRKGAGCPACTDKHSKVAENKWYGWAPDATKGDSKLTKKATKLVRGVNDLYTWASKNNPDIIKCYSPNNKIDIHNMPKSSSKEVELVCSTCGYTWKSSPNKMTTEGLRCPACAAKAGEKVSKTITGINDLFTWASENNPKLIKEYSKNNKKDIHNISKASNYKAEWVCSTCGYTWSTEVRHRTMSGIGCPACSLRG